MFEETSNNAFHTDRIFGRMKVVVVELLSDGTNFALVASGTSPNITTVNGGTTIALSGVSKASNYWFSGTIDDVAGVVTASVTAQDANAGTVSLLASAATAGTRFKFFFLANRTG